jgi:two-component system phosphate regulon response regulator PhoB
VARILIIDDDPELTETLDRHLAQEGHERCFAATVAAGVEAAQRLRPDLVLLEWSLGDGTGGDVCVALRAESETRDIPLVFVTARGEESDRIHGLELGAADYVVKPFSARELVLRVRAVLRRGTTSWRPRAIEHGRLRIDPDAHRVWVGGGEVTLTRIEYELLLALVEAQGRVRTRTDLLDVAWGGDVTVTDRTVDTHVKRLRDKLGLAAPYVQTVRGIGYRFAAAPAR